MSRVTAPVAKLARALGSAPAVSRTSTVHNSGAVLMPKYAELLRNRRAIEHSESSRRLTTTHRPTPQPSLANRSKPLMQTFSSSASSSASVSASISHHLDATFLPSLDSTDAVASSDLPRIPLLPDSSSAAHGSLDADAPVFIPSAAIVAANPDNVIPATALSEVHSFGIDLSFMHAAEATRQETPRMIKDLWKGLIDDTVGSHPVPKTI